MRCPFCDCDRRDLRGLVRHLLRDHASRPDGPHPSPRVNGHRLHGDGGPKWTRIWCWCGQPFSSGRRNLREYLDAEDVFALHLEDCGGLEAHLLAIALGLEG